MAHKERLAAVRSLMDRCLEIVHGEKNRRNAKLWEDSRGWNRDKLRGIRPSRAGGRLPFVVEIDISLWRSLFGDVDLREYYADPYLHMEIQLQQKIMHHELFDDSFVLTDELYIWFGVVTELSLFGSPVEFQKHKEGWIKGPVLRSCGEAGSLAPPDFRASGLMPRVHEFYEVMREAAEGRMKVMFPELARGPFCIAAHLRGMEDFLCDALTEPESVHKLMRRITDGHKAWSRERARFLGEEPGKCKLFNDEIDSPSISPAMYDELVFPYEKELAEHYGGVRYFHSCGNITPFLPSIAKLPGLDVCHMGPWTSYAEGDRIFSGGTALEICLHPVNDVMLADENAMRARLEDILAKCPHRNFSVRADTFMPSGDPDAQLGKIRMWEKIAKEYFGG